MSMRFRSLLIAMSAGPARLPKKGLLRSDVSRVNLDLQIYFCSNIV